jgi:hypothetical protein
MEKDEAGKHDEERTYPDFAQEFLSVFCLPLYSSSSSFLTVGE